MNFAFYGRYSTDLQDPTSIEDQFRIAQDWCLKNGHEIVARFEDQGISGEKFKSRKGIQDLLERATQKSRPFDGIIVFHLSRLSRSLKIILSICDTLNHHALVLISVSEPADSRDSNFFLSQVFNGAKDQLFLKDLKAHVKKGMTSTFLKGYVTGRVPYGFATEAVQSGRTDPRGTPIPDGFIRIIHPEHAEHIREMFRLWDEGKTLRDICRMLLAHNPQERWTRPRVTLMLQNTAYLGRFYYNKTRVAMNPTTEKSEHQSRDRAEWLVYEDEKLRLVEQECWDRVQDRLDKKKRGHISTGNAARYPLSGLLFCLECGRRFTNIQSGYYKCELHATVPDMADSTGCSNGLRIRMEAIEQVVVSALTQHLIPYLEQIHQAATQHLQEHTREVAAGTDRITALREQVDRINKAIATGILEERALKDELDRLNNLWKEIGKCEREQKKASHDHTAIEVHYSRSMVEQFLAELPRALRARPGGGHELLTQLIQKVTIEPLPGLKICPVCKKPIKKAGWRHLNMHGLRLPACYAEHPSLGFSQPARLAIELNPTGILAAGKMIGLEIMGTQTFLSEHIQALVISAEIGGVQGPVCIKAI